jgi:HSP90 family molecular chaperone
VDYLDIEKVQNLVKTYSQFISFPIYVGREKHEVIKVSFCHLQLYVF